MNRIGNLDCQALEAGYYGCYPETGEKNIPSPVLMPPGTTKAVPTTPLSAENLLKRQAYTGYFIQHLVRFTMSSVSFGLSLAATVLSGGAGLPLAAVTGSAMIVAAGDACCALYNLIQVRNDREPLKTGTDSILTAVKALMTTCGLNDSHAETVGDVASCALRVGLALSSIFVPAAQLAGSTADIMSKCSAGITATLTAVGGVINISTARIERMQGSIAATGKPVPAAGEDQKEKGLFSEEEINKMVNQIVDCYERYRPQPQLNTSRVSFA